MNRFHAIARLAVLVAGLAVALPAFCAGCVSVAVARVPVPWGGGPHRRPSLASRLPRPPGWNKHPPLPDPARIHAALAGGIPGWQVTLMAVTVVLLAATLVAIAYPGPGRAVAGEHTSPNRMTASGAAGVRPGGSADGESAAGTGTKARSATAGCTHVPSPAVGAGTHVVN